MAKQLTLNEEVLFRQIHPASLQKGKPSSDRFRPSQRDENKLSVDRGSRTSAEASHLAYVSGGRESGAVFGVNVGEFGEYEVPCLEDPVKNDPNFPDNPAHALADYSGHDEKKQKVMAKRLLQLALHRGCLYSVAPEDEA